MSNDNWIGWNVVYNNYKLNKKEDKPTVKELEAGVKVLQDKIDEIKNEVVAKFTDRQEVLVKWCHKKDVTPVVFDGVFNTSYRAIDNEEDLKYAEPQSCKVFKKLPMTIMFDDNTVRCPMMYLLLDKYDEIIVVMDINS